MKSIYHIISPVYFLILLCWITSLLLRQFISSDWLTSYVDDILCLPIVLGFALIIQRKVVLKHSLFCFSRLQITAVWLYFSVVFELIFPFITNAYITDWLDIGCYGLGVIIFALAINQPITKTASLQ
ncbi:MAG: hypothetical protein MUC81_10725 [Bacteroidia bacterium]|jgi:hypothetical protein|nr:hypothetical protein [Bacteroidia bacterium]